MKIKKWLFKEKEYKDIEVDDHCNYMPIGNMEQLVICPNCGKEVRVGDTYTSLEYYSNNKLWGLNVCPECYEKELDKDYEYRNES